MLGVPLGSGGGVAEKESLKNRDFSIISHKESISLLCLAWIVAIVVAITDVTTLVINC